MATDFHLHVRDLLDAAVRQDTAVRTGFLRRASERTTVLREALALLPHYLAARLTAPDAVAPAPAALWNPAGFQRDNLIITPPFPVPPYNAVELLGAGGMGVVYRGIDRARGREVAIKLLRQDLVAAEDRCRFKQEEELLRQLRHPGIVRFLHGGSAPLGRPAQLGGLPPERPYIVMEFVRGRSLVRYAAECGLDALARLRLFLEVCAAVEFAHNRGVVHRDLKPDNILVGPDQRPKILDFGIAQLESEDARAPAEQRRFVGTPAYASPEQRGRRAAGLTPASDVYTLGLILHELLTGSLPERSAGRIRLDLNAVRLPDRHPARAAELEFQYALHTIIATTLRAAGTRPYRQAGELARALERVLAAYTAPTGWRGLVQQIRGLFRTPEAEPAPSNRRLLATVLRKRIDWSLNERE